MNRKLLFGFFLLAIGISFIINKFTYQNKSYAYSNIKNPIVRIYYLDKENDSLVLKDQKSSFQILNSNGEIVTSFETFIGNEYIETSVLSLGEYTIRQTRGAEDYEIYPDETIYIDTNDVLNVYLMAVKSNPPKIAISLTDIKTNKLLDKAEFHLLKDDNLIDTCTTIKGYCYFYNIKNGNYILENVIPAKGYISLDKINITFNNEKIKYLMLNASSTKLVINSYNKNILIKNDGKYQIYDLKNNLIYNLNDLKYIENIPIGSYYLKEINTPNGYKTISNKIPFEIKDINDEQILNIYYTRLDKDNDYINLFMIIGIIFTFTGLIYIFIYYKNKILVNNNNGDQIA